MRIAMIGTRGVPARYGGFETAVEEVGRRLVDRDHRVTVYCRGDAERPDKYAGMDLVHLPSLRSRSVETLSHTALSMLHQVRHGNHDVAIVFNAANSILLPLLRIRGLPTATHVDGLEWRRGKWGPCGQRYYRAAETLAVRWSDRLIADAQGIADYYAGEFGATTELIAYGAPLVDENPSLISVFGLRPQRYHLVVARFEPENHVDIAIKGYLHSNAKLPLVVVGSAPYTGEHVREIERLAATDERVRMLGGVWDQDALDQLYANAASYIHGHSVGGTNPSLLRAMGAGAPVIAYDVIFNREVVGKDGLFFGAPYELARHLDRAEADPATMRRLGDGLRERAASVYTWDQVAKEYEALCERLVRGESQRGHYSGRRRHAPGWRR